MRVRGLSIAPTAKPTDPPTIAPTEAMKRTSLPIPVRLPSAKNRSETKKTSKREAITAEKTPVITPIRTSSALPYIAVTFADIAPVTFS